MSEGDEKRELGNINVPQDQQGQQQYVNDNNIAVDSLNMGSTSTMYSQQNQLQGIPSEPINCLPTSIQNLQLYDTGYQNYGGFHPLTNPYQPFEASIQYPNMYASTSQMTMPPIIPQGVSNYIPPQHRMMYGTAPVGPLPSGTAKSPSSASSNTNSSTKGQDRTRYRQRRDKNNEAAKRCREKKRRESKKSEEENRLLKEENQELRTQHWEHERRLQQMHQQIQKLIQENDQLKLMLRQGQQTDQQ